MTQYGYEPLSPADSGSILLERLNGVVPALLTNHKGAARPGYVQPGMMWVDDSGATWLLNLYDGTNDVAIAQIDPTAHALIAAFVPPTRKLKVGSGLSLDGVAGNDAEPAEGSLAADRLLKLLFATPAEAAAGVLVGRPVDPAGLAAAVGALSPGISAGIIADFGFSTPPTGWLECNGAAISRTAYAHLFAAIGTTWGAGDGSSTFNIPDFRGVFRRGWDHGRGYDSGRVFASYQADDFKSHTHTVTAAGGSGSGFQTSSTNSGANYTTSATGGTETRPKNYAPLPVIKY